MKKIFMLSVFIFLLSVLPGCEQQLDFPFPVSFSDSSQTFGAVTEKDAATHLLIIDSDSALSGELSPYLGKYTREGEVSYACYDGYFSPDDAIRVNLSSSDSDLIPADSLWLRPSDSAKLRVSPSRESETLCLVSSGSIYPVCALSFTDALYYVISAEDGRGYLLSDAAETGCDRAELEFEAAMGRYSPVGAQMTLIDNGRITGTYAFGFSDIENGTEMTPDTTIRCASLSKVLFCICAMKLGDEGVIDIDADIGTFWGIENLSNSRYGDETVSVRTILNHTSSIRERSDYADYEELKKLFAGRNFFDTSKKPGTKNAWEYSNFAVSVGGATLEVAAGRTMQDYACETIFEPLDITASYGSADLPSGCSDAVLYRSGGKPLGSDSPPDVAVSDLPGDNAHFFPGGLHISSRDYAKLLLMLINDGIYEDQRILSEDAVNEIEAPCFDIGTSLSQCLILRRGELYGRTLYYHTGNAYGTIAMASYDPESGDGVVIIATGADKSTAPNGIYEICDSLSRLMYAEIL